MSLKTPPEIFHDWLGQHAKETRVSVVVDSDRFLAEAKVLDKPTVIDPAGREWQLAVFRGDDLAFRLRFRDCITKDRTVIVLSRGPDTTEPIGVSYVADIVARNEAGEPLDLSVVAFFRRVAPKINFPTSELRRFKSELLGRIDHVEKAADKLILRWGKPDSWGRGQVAAMVLLAHHPDLNLSDIWPDETTPAEFLAHVVRLLVGTSELRPHREVVRQVIHEAARAQVSEVIFWAEADPEELAAYLVLREFAAQAKLQNPATQLAGLQVFSPELSLSKMELSAPGVIVELKKQPKLWRAVNLRAETFLTPRRTARIVQLITPAKDISDVSLLLKQDSPAVLRQQLFSLLLSFFEQPNIKVFSWVSALEDHSLLRPVEIPSERAQQCRAALNLLLRLNRIEQRLAEAVPIFQHADTLLDWYTGKTHHLLELELAYAHHDLQHCGDGDDQMQEKGQAYLFGNTDELSATAASLKGRILARLRQLDEALASFVRQGPEDFGRGAKSVRGFLRSKIDVTKIRAGTLSGRVWVLVFDGMRFDTWDAVIKPRLAESFEIEDAPYFCVLPSYTEFARTGLLSIVAKVMAIL